MDVKDFYYDLPKELIAQDPLSHRSSSRLLVLHRESGELEHRHFEELLDYLKPGDCLVLNNTRVIPARLFGERENTQAKIELLLLKRKEKESEGYDHNGERQNWRLEGSEEQPDVSSR